MTLAEQLVKTLSDEEISTTKELHQIKNKFSAQYSIPAIPNLELVAAYKKLVGEEVIPPSETVLRLIQKRRVRSMSGITSVTVTTKPYVCPGKCIYCPTEANMPKSYLSNQPAMMRAILNNFDPFEQTHNRLRALEVTGHDPEKIDVIIIGGTFSYFPTHYKRSFIRGIFNALNSYQDAKTYFEPAKHTKYKFAEFTKKGKSTFPKARSLAEAHTINETAQQRCIGLTVETRPDYVDQKEVKLLRTLGVTRVEMGVQSVDPHVLEVNKRVHGRQEVIDSIRLLKDAGLKVSVHIMPGLYQTTREKDIAMFKELFSNPDFQPDHIKVYPCMVLPFTYLERLYKKGEYTPYTAEEAVDVISEGLQYVPEYVRIIRMAREIPKESIIAGCTNSNLREMIEEKMAEKGLTPRDIRYREPRDKTINWDTVTLVQRSYDASEGKEHFLSFEDTSSDTLLAFLRLRFPPEHVHKKHFIKELTGAALVREVHTYGKQLSVKTTESNYGPQHKGLGKKLLREAEQQAKEAGFIKLAVISGIGVREYYKKQGYHLEGTYMVKYL